MIEKLWALQFSAKETSMMEPFLGLTLQTTGFFLLILRLQEFGKFSRFTKNPYFAWKPLFLRAFSEIKSAKKKPQLVSKKKESLDISMVQKYEFYYNVQ